MEVTREYLAAHEVGRTRPEASYGAIRVVIENYSDETHIFGKSMIYLSLDNGMNFMLLNWKVSWLSWWKTLGREWPPHHVSIKGLDHDGLHLSYFEAIDDSPPSYTVVYRFADEMWRI